MIVTPPADRQSAPSTTAHGGRVTATEWIDGVEHLVILEDDGGGFQEVSLMPLDPSTDEPAALDRHAAPAR